jgi:D-aminopeptidase
MNQEQKTQKFSRGKKNSITDLKDVRVGHLTVSKDFVDASGKNVAIRTGLTAVLPYPMEKEMRLFAQLFSINGRNEVTGYEVLDDFCYLNSPIVITNAFNVGTVYNAILSYGFLLGRSEIWPPLIIGINDSFLNDMREGHLDEKDILDAFTDASVEKVEEGSVGIGLGLRAFGWKGGIGSASRLFSLGHRRFTCGVLVASNHSNQKSLTGTRVESHSDQDEENSLIVIMGVDVPLVPYQIKNILENLVFNLPSANIVKDHLDGGTCLLFSTANPMSMVEEGPSVFDFQAIDDSLLGTIIRSGKEAINEAVSNSLFKATPVHGRLGRICRTIPDNELHKLYLDAGEKS